jgi:hypothetical protein
MRWRGRIPATATLVMTAAASGALAATLLAVATAWWILTDPAGAAAAAASRDWTVVAGAITRGLVRALFAR